MTTTFHQKVILITRNVWHATHTKIGISKGQAFRGSGQIFYFMSTGSVNHAVPNLFKSFWFIEKMEKTITRYCMPLLNYKCDKI